MRRPDAVVDDDEIDDGKVRVRFEKSELEQLRELGVKGLPRSRAVVVTLTRSGTLVDLSPPGLNGPGVDMLIDRARKQL